MIPARILIITNGHLSRNPRVVKEAETLGRAGFDVTVLHVRNHPPSEALDVELTRGAPYRREIVEVQRGAGLRAFRRQIGGWLARQATRRLGWQSLRSLGPVGSLLRRARTLPADLTIVHNEVPHGVGLRLHAEGRTVAADIEDWHSEDLLPEDRRHRPLALLRQQEKALINNLPYTTTTSQALADELHARFGGKRPQVISNAFPLQSNPRTTTASGDDTPAFFWFSQRLGPGRGLELFLAAWARTTLSSRVYLLGEPQRGYCDHLTSILPASHRDRLSFLDCVPPAVLPDIIARHDIGLALEQSSIRNRDLTVTNKILQYLNAGLAVVATDTAGQREVLSHSPEAGMLVSPEQTVEFAAALETLLRDRTALRRRQQAARRLAEDVYCWEREGPHLVALVRSAIERRTLPGTSVG